jgi:hypothetical protein
VQLAMNMPIGDDALFLVDSLVPPMLDHRTVVISSPGRLAAPDLTDRLNQYHLVRIHVPIPTDKELLAMQAVAFPRLDVPGVKLRMEMWGPIPRLVLASDSIAEQRELWLKAQSVSLERMIAVAQDVAETGKGDERKAPHIIVHERAAGQDADPGTPGADDTHPEYYVRGRVAIASPVLLRYVAERIDAESRWSAAFLVDASVRIPSLSSLRGIKFEDLAMDVLAAGGDFQIKPLGTSRGSTLSLPCLSRKEWKDLDDLAELTRRGPAFLVPPIRNQAGLDALVWPAGDSHPWPLDFTVANKHGIHMQGVCNVLNALGWTAAGGWPSAGTAAAASSSDSAAGAAGASDPSLRRAMQVKYYWALPEDRFAEAWRPQTAANDSCDSREAKTLSAHVAQFALCIPKLLVCQRVAAACEHAGVRTPVEHLQALEALGEPSAMVGEIIDDDAIGTGASGVDAAVSSAAHGSAATAAAAALMASADATAAGHSTSGAKHSGQ